MPSPRVIYAGGDVTSTPTPGLRSVRRSRADHMCAQALAHHARRASPVRTGCVNSRNASCSMSVTCTRPRRGRPRRRAWPGLLGLRRASLLAPQGRRGLGAARDDRPAGRGENVMRAIEMPRAEVHERILEAGLLALGGGGSARGVRRCALVAGGGRGDRRRRGASRHARGGRAHLPGVRGHRPPQSGSVQAMWRHRPHHRRSRALRHAPPQVAISRPRLGK
jgi:hypothetical protein